MSHRKPKSAHITDRRAVACSCPNCSAELSAFTGVAFDHFFPAGPIELEGNPTMCAYCGALLIFADNAGRVREMTESERNSVQFEPYVKQLLDEWKAKIDRERKRAEAFTRTRFN
jgi:hypothetical protein